MPDIKDSVGEGGSNQVHDVALLQAMLRVVKDAKNAPYLGVDYDGSYGAQTRAALERFQNDHKLAPAKAAPGQPQAGGAKEALGLAAAGGATVAKLSGMLPEIGRASGRERGEISVVAGSLKKKQGL